MNRKWVSTFFIIFTWAAVAIGEETPAVSTASVSGSTVAVAAPVVSSAPAAVPLVSTVTLPTIGEAPAITVSSATVPIDHVDNARLRRLLGTLKTIDLAGHKMVVEDREGKSAELLLTQRTRVMADDGHRLNVSELKPGDRVNIRYVENYNYVRKIDLLPPGQ